MQKREENYGESPRGLWALISYCSDCSIPYLGSGTSQSPSNKFFCHF